jgi:hypothetical protein
MHNVPKISKPETAVIIRDTTNNAKLPPKTRTDKTIAALNPLKNRESDKLDTPFFNIIRVSPKRIFYILRMASTCCGHGREMLTMEPSLFAPSKFVAVGQEDKMRNLQKLNQE